MNILKAFNCLQLVGKYDFTFETMSKYKLIKIGNRHHVLKCHDDRGGQWQDANYKGSNKALCGILKHGESLEAWKKRTKKLDG